MSSDPAREPAEAGAIHPSKEALRAAFALTQRVQLPHIPDVIVELRSELAGSYPDARRVADLVAQDPALAGGLIKRVNSAALAGVEPIESVQQAVVRLGMDEVTRLLTAEALGVVTAGGGPEVHRVWESIVETAAVAAAVARHAVEIDVAEAYLFSMMHDVAHILFTRLDPRLAELHDLAGTMPVSVLERERRRVGVDHATVGFLFARHWDFPDYFALAVFHHHALDFARFEDPRIRALIAVAQLASDLTASHLRDLELPEAVQIRVGARRELMLTDETWHELKADALNSVLEDR